MEFLMSVDHEIGRPRDCTTEDGTVYEKEHGDQQYLQEVC